MMTLRIPSPNSPRERFRGMGSNLQLVVYTLFYQFNARYIGSYGIKLVPPKGTLIQLRLYNTVERGLPKSYIKNEEFTIVNSSAEVSAARNSCKLWCELTGLNTGHLIQ